MSHLVQDIGQFRYDNCCFSNKISPNNSHPVLLEGPCDFFRLSGRSRRKCFDIIHMHMLKNKTCCA